MKIRAVIYEHNGVFGSEVPAFPGCFASGESMQELRANLREAVQLYIEAQENTKVRRAARKKNVQILEVRL